VAKDGEAGERRGLGGERPEKRGRRDGFWGGAGGAGGAAVTCSGGWATRAMSFSPGRTARLRLEGVAPKLFSSMELFRCRDHAAGGRRGGPGELGRPRRGSPPGLRGSESIGVGSAFTVTAPDRRRALEDSRPAVELRAIEVVDARTHNLKSVSCRVPHGRVTVVTGPSGAGKSSLAFDTIFAEGSAVSSSRCRPTRASSSTRWSGRRSGTSATCRRRSRSRRRTRSRTRARPSAPSPRSTTFCACSSRTSAWSAAPRVTAPRAAPPRARWPRRSRRRDGGSLPARRPPGAPEARRRRQARRAGAPGLRAAPRRRRDRADRARRRLAGEARPAAARARPLRADPASTARLAATVEDAWRLGARVVEARARPACATTRPSSAVRSAASRCGPLAGAVQLQLAARRLPDLRRLRPRHRRRRRAGDPRPRPEPRRAADRALEHARLRGALRRALRGGEAARRAARPSRGAALGRASRLALAGEGSFVNLDSFFRWLEGRSYKVHVRVLLARYRAYNPCPDCHGARLNREALAVTFAGRTLPALAAQSVETLRDWFAGLELSARQQEVGAHLLAEIAERLEVLHRVRPRLPDARPPGAHPLGGRDPAHPSRGRPRLGAHLDPLRARRADHRPPSARRREAARPAARSRGARQPPCWWSSTTRPSSAAPTG